MINAKEARRLAQPEEQLKTKVQKAVNKLAGEIYEYARNGNLSLGVNPDQIGFDAFPGVKETLENEGFVVTTTSLYLATISWE